MARVPVIPPLPRNAPIVDQNGYPTQVFQDAYDAAFDRIGKELGELPAKLVNEQALDDQAGSTRVLADKAVTEPKQGDNSASNRVLATDSVSTVKVQANAITEGTTSLAGNVDITNTNSWTTVASTQHNATGRPVAILYAAYYQIDNKSGGTDKLLWGRLVRDSMVVSANNLLLSVAAGGWLVGNFPYFLNDQPSVGTYTYKFQVITTEDNETGPFDEQSLSSPTTWSGTSQATDATFRTLETKR